MSVGMEAKAEPENSCCALWKEKYAKSEAYRNALRQAVKLFEEQTDKYEAEIQNLKKVYEEEKLRADTENEAKAKEAAVRVSLEKELSSLKSEIALLQQKRDPITQDVSGEVTLLQARLSEAQTEIIKLKELLEKEKKRADSEKKKAHTEKKKAAETSKLVQLEKSRAEEHRLQLEKLRSEADETKSKLGLDTSKYEEANKRLEMEKQKAIREKKRADAEVAKAEEQRNLAETNRKKSMEEKCRADQLARKIEELEKEIRRFESENQKLMKEKKRVGPEIAKVEEQRKLAEANRINSLAEKDRADQLAREVEELQKEIRDLMSKKKLVKASGEYATAYVAKMKLLRKELKFEKRRVKFAKQVTKLERDRNNMLNEEVHRLTQQFVQFSHRMGVLDSYFLPKIEGIVGPAKVGNFLSTQGLDLKKGSSGVEPLQMYPPSAPEPLRSSCTPMDAIQCSVPVFPTESISGINRKMLQSSAINSSTASFSDSQLVGSQERGAFLVATSAKLGRENLNLQPAIEVTQTRNNKNLAVVAENSVRSPMRNIDHGEEKETILDAVESIKTLYSEGKKLDMQIAEKLSILRCALDEHVSDPQHDSCARQVGSHKEPKVSSIEARVPHIYKELSFGEMFDGDYMKLLALENPVEEERYRMAIERPLSPTLPEIDSPRVENFEIDDFEQLPETCLPNVEAILVPPGSFDVINEEINGSPPGPACDRFLNYFIVFSDANDNENISRILRATKVSIARCCLVSETDSVVPKILTSLVMEESLFPRERGCVFISLLLHNFCEAASNVVQNFMSREALLSLDSLAADINIALSDVETRVMFSKLCPLSDLLYLIEDFLLDRKVLVHDNNSSESSPVHNSRIDICLDDENIILFRETASTQQLVAGSILLASICSATHHVGFICEASYNILRTHKSFSSLTTTILHVFAYLCGTEYLTLGSCSLVMTVMKSIVTFFEKEKSSNEVSPCVKCPFYEAAVSMDVVVSILLEKLENYVLSDTVHKAETASVGPTVLAQDQNEEIGREAFLVDDGKCDPNFSFEKCVITASLEGTLCQIMDVLSLVELVACNMTWEWVCNQIVPKLLKILESCVVENFSVAIIVLLGQLGRRGVDANGYEDATLENMTRQLSVFVCDDNTRKSSFPIQISAVSALLGLVSLDFKQLIKNNKAIASQSTGFDLIKKWFSSLSSEQQSLSLTLLNSDDLGYNCEKLDYVTQILH